MPRSAACRLVATLALALVALAGLGGLFPPDDLGGLFGPAGARSWDSYTRKAYLVKADADWDGINDEEERSCIALWGEKQRLMRRIVAKHADFFSAAEAARAVVKFAPEAVMRHRLSELWWARRYGEAQRFALETLISTPRTFSPAAILAARRVRTP